MLIESWYLANVSLRGQGWRGLHSTQAVSTVRITPTDINCFNRCEYIGIYSTLIAYIGVSFDNKTALSILLAIIPPFAIRHDDDDRSTKPTIGRGAWRRKIYPQ